MDKFELFLLVHRPQLESAQIPPHLWECLYHKLIKDNYESDGIFSLLQIDYEDQEQIDEEENVDHTEERRPTFILRVIKDNLFNVNNPNAIYLIDHTWTFRSIDKLGRQQLQQHPNLLQRMCQIMGIHVGDIFDSSNRNKLIEKVLRRRWRYAHTYSLSRALLEGNKVQVVEDDESRNPYWYVLDELGSAILHTNTKPNCRMVPFIYLDTNVTYSVLFPIADCNRDVVLKRDFLEYIAKYDPAREVLSYPWIFKDFKAVNFQQLEPGEEYFLKGHVPETYLEDNQLKNATNQIYELNLPLKVYTDYDLLAKHLTNQSKFILTENRDEADILWLMEHFKNYAELVRDTPKLYVNQFPFEYVITIKDLLAVICRRQNNEINTNDLNCFDKAYKVKKLETYPRWLPTTYNLKTELIQFASYYQNRKQFGLDNYWIVKPWNLARSLNTHITNNLSEIVRLPCTGPKIAQKYIENPVLFLRNDINVLVKFDIRYVLLVKSMKKPIEAYIDRKFYLRFCNKAFSLTHFDDYDKHFTVMNYRMDEGVQNELGHRNRDDELEVGSGLHHLKCEDFFLKWSRQYPDHPWSKIEDDICTMLYEMLECSIQLPPPRGIGHCAQSRAMYAVDIILEWSNDVTSNTIDNDIQPVPISRRCIQPKLLEVNWSPDCERACKYYPDFYNDIFDLLFLNKSNEKIFRLLTK